MSEKWQLLTKVLRHAVNTQSSVFLYQLPWAAAKCYWVVVRAEEQLKNTEHPKYQAVYALPQSGLKPGVA